jgi:hypothetical protein
MELGLLKEQIYYFDKIKIGTTNLFSEIFDEKLNLLLFACTGTKRHDFYKKEIFWINTDYLPVNFGLCINERSKACRK